MNPIAAAAIGSIIRWALAFVAGYLVEHGIWSPGDATSYVAAASLGILALAWSLWQKYKNRITFLTALQSPAGTSEAAVQSKIETGMGAKLLPMILLVLALGAGSLGATSCTKAPPNLTPAATHAFYSSQILKDADRLREVAVAAHATTPPLLTADEALAIVTWHKAAITTIHDAPTGWKATVQTGLDQALLALSPKARQAVQPYVVLVRALLQEIP